MLRRSVPLLFVIATMVSCDFGRSRPKHIFINETSDHRFDESIKMSIMAAHARTGVQNAVFISDGKTESASKLFQNLDVGRDSKGRGILYYYSPRAKRLDIEVGYGLEGVLPDALIKGLELGAKSFIYSDRYQDFWAELINTINIQVASTQQSDFDFSKFTYLSGGAGISSRNYEATLAQFKTESRALVAASNFKARTSIRESLDLYLQSLGQGVGDPELDLLTEESRIRRRIVPTTNFQLYRNYKMYQESGGERIIQEGNLAFVFYGSNRPVLPIILRKEKNLWRIHEPLSWSLFHRFEDSMHVYLKFPIAASQEFMTLLKEKTSEPLYRGPLVSVDLISKPLSPTPSALELFFKLFWLEPVAEKLLNSNRIDEQWILLDAYQNLGKVGAFVQTYKKLSDLHPNDLKLQSAAKFYKEITTHKREDWRLQR